ncbi:calcium/sodium antiporter [Ornithinimicrobium sp. Y1694]|uniref:calcium/sodium antiporter n=1 Tax=Ornithinimicrobium sp. Y1694 TaxID=3418590 RepID=UPI003CE92061
MDLLDIGRVLLGVILLVGGGELLVRGASSLARRAGLSSLVVGLTVVAFATSAPELAVTLDAVFDGQPELAVGNVVGSNIANVLLILGISALITPLTVKRQLVRLDVPAMVGLSAIALVLAIGGAISPVGGVVLVTLLLAHTVLTVLVSRREARREQRRARRLSREPNSGGDGSEATHGVLVSIVLVAVGVGLLVLGARVLVVGAVNIAESLGVSGLVIGLTVVAIGTSLPELATSIIAAARGEQDMAVGNIVGSCIFNIGIVLGLPAIIAPGGEGIAVPGAAIALDLPLMIASALALAPVVFTGYAVARWEGAVFLALYAAYLAFVVLNSTRHEALDGFTFVLAAFLLPLVAVTLVATTLYEVKRRRERRAAMTVHPANTSA